MQELNTYNILTADPSNQQMPLVGKPTGFQSAIDSIHLYPFVTVIEKRRNPMSEFVSARRGTEWNGFPSRELGQHSKPSTRDRSRTCTGFPTGS